MRIYSIKLTGTTPLLHHWDNLDWADEMDAWKNDSGNKKGSKPGDDRSPAWRWLGSLYHDGRVVGIPTENLMTAIREGGTLVPVPGGKSGKSFKSQTQSGMIARGSHFPVTVGGIEIPVRPVMDLRHEKDFLVHKERALSLGFQLFLKRARVGQTKHVRVRPRFEQWETAGLLEVNDEQITTAVLQDILTQTGNYKGLGDWRPGGRTPGPYGMFTAEVTQQS
jgi:hypothetical protein